MSQMLESFNGFTLGFIFLQDMLKYANRTSDRRLVSVEVRSQ